MSRPTGIPGQPWRTTPITSPATGPSPTRPGRVSTTTSDGDLSNAPSGYLWDACARAGLSYRSYGEYGRRVSQPDGSFKIEGAVPGLVGHMCPDYGIAKKPGRRSRDTDNAETFIKEFQRI